MKRRGTLRIAFALGTVALIASVSPGRGASVAPPLGIAEALAEGAISVGDHLEALANVSLQRAEIRKGSRVHVTRVVQNQGATVVDVELPDGYIVKNLSLAQVRSSFRIVRDA